MRGLLTIILVKLFTWIHHSVLWCITLIGGKEKADVYDKFVDKLGDYFLVIVLIFGVLGFLFAIIMAILENI